ncbi:MAG: hypothetical protein Q7S40_18740 [Opitutaceae bacterium]|nr:hypothetical protein [Opitutaceae bacterium]
MDTLLFEQSEQPKSDLELAQALALFPIRHGLLGDPDLAGELSLVHFEAGTQLVNLDCQYRDRSVVGFRPSGAMILMACIKRAASEAPAPRG